MFSNGTLNAFLVMVIALFTYRHLFETDIKKKKPLLQPRGYRLIYTDQKGGYDDKKVIVSEMLYSKTYDLRGKPDYIFMDKKNRMLPVEVKSGKIGKRDKPHLSDLMQLVAYFLMIEDVFHVKVPEGRVIYKDYMFIIKNTKELKAQLMTITQQMRQMLETGEGTSHASFVVCRYCMCNQTVCEKNKSNDPKGK